MSIQERTPADSYGSVEQPHLEQPSRNCCKIKYRVRCFYSKGAFLVLLWITLISATARYYGEVFSNNIQDISSPYAILILLPLYICIPFIGWTADAKFGNYKLFRAGIILLFIAVISSVGIPQIPHLEISSTVGTVLSIISDSLGVIGIATCATTGLQLGLDQMPDASADNITSFIAWFVISATVGLCVPSVLFSPIIICINISQVNLTIYTKTMYLIAPVCTAVVCCTVFIFTPRCLVVEPKSPKALKTIYQVLKFTAKHKAPLNRSAFTYWEEDIPSRLDLGKSRYGGPFTTEQVEDVKTFFKILIMLIPISIIFLTLIAGNFNYLFAIDTCNCSSQLHDTFTHPLCNVLIFTVAYELGIYPLIRNRIPTTLKRTVIGSFLVLLTKSIFLVESIVSLYSTQPTMANNTESYLPTLLSDEAWANTALVLTQNIVLMLLINGLLEFVCAQSPYNMRGLLTGCAVFMMITSLALGTLIQALIYQPYNKDVCKKTVIVRMVTDHRSREVCQRAGIAALSLIGFILYCVLAHWYKRRVRDEDYPVHRVVEEVYDRYLSHAH